MRWLQLCDLHLGAPSEAQSLAMAQFVRAIEQAVEGFTLDLVLFAGDIAYSGKSTEYEEVIKTVIKPLRDLPATRSAVFVAVPGNHDLNCDDNVPLTWNILGRERQEVFWNSDASGQKLRLSRAKGFEAYANFMKQADIVGPDPVRDVGALVPIHGERMVNLLCLNTAFFSDKYFSDDEERGKSPFPVQTFS